MKRKLLALMVAVLSVAAIGLTQLQTNAAGGRDCDNNAIIRCGAYSLSELKSKYTQNTTHDLDNIYSHYGIGAGAITSGRDGVVTKSGDVIVGGKVVATNATSIGRQPISGSWPIKIDGKTYYDSKNSTAFLSDQISAYVYFDGNGKFVAFILKSCGNPGTGTPKPPAPKPAAACKALTVSKLSDTSYRFNAYSTVSGGAKVNSYTYQVSKAGHAVYSKTTTASSLTYNQTTPGTYQAKLTVNTTAGNKTSASCVKNFTVPVPPQPAAACKALTVDQLERTTFRLNGSATTSNGATVSQYVFRIYRGNDLVDTKTVSSSALSASTEYSQATAGSYTVKLSVKTSVGDKTGPGCEAPLTVVPPKTPAVEVNKLVDGVKYERVGVNVRFTYQIRVTNTGEVDLTDVKLTDTPQKGVTLLSASQGDINGNVWTYTVPKLAIGEHMDFTLQAKVPVYKAGRINNTVCVNAPQVPGNPDDCSSAEVSVPEKVQVCNPATGEIITVKKDQADQYAPIGSPACEQTVPPVTPTELPTTGPTDTLVRLIGVFSLTGALTYYIASRRTL